MKFRINKKAAISAKAQLVAQVELALATRRLKPGDLLPSVKAVALQAGLHPNTVSQAYSSLVSAGYLVRRPGARLTVRDLENLDRSDQGMDAILNAAMRSASEAGYSHAEFRAHVLRRFSTPDPDHVLVVARDPKLLELLCAELREQLACGIRSCPLTDIGPDFYNPATLVVTHPAAAQELSARMDRRQPFMVLRYSDTRETERRIRELTGPSIIAAVSVSSYVLEFAGQVIRIFAEDRHTVREVVSHEGIPSGGYAADLVICDWLVFERTRPELRERLVAHRIVDESSLRQIEGAIPGAVRTMKSSAQGVHSRI